MMKRLTLLAIGMTLALANLSAHAGSKLEADVTGAESVTDTAIVPATDSTPAVTLPVTGLVTGALGKARFRLMPDGSLSYTLKVSVLPATPIFMAHIHLGPKGRNGPVLLWLFGHAASGPNPAAVFPRNDGPFTGEISGVLTAANLTIPANSGITNFTDAIRNILAGNAYVNVHTVARPGGEIRGQIGRSHHGHD